MLWLCACLFYFCISFQGVLDFSEFACAVLDISEYMNTHFTATMMNWPNRYWWIIDSQYVYLMYVNLLVYNYHDITYLIKHIRHMMIPTATTIIKATTTPNTTFDTPLHSSVNINGYIYDNCMIKMTSKLFDHLRFHVSAIHSWNCFYMAFDISLFVFFIWQLCYMSVWLAQLEF